MLSNCWRYERDLRLLREPVWNDPPCRMRRNREDFFREGNTLSNRALHTVPCIDSPPGRSEEAWLPARRSGLGLRWRKERQGRYFEEILLKKFFSIDDWHCCGLSYEEVYAQTMHYVVGIGADFLRVAAISRNLRSMPERSCGFIALSPKLK